MPLEPGICIGPYEVTGLLGAGGMGEVYRARDSKLDRDVALKVLPPAFTDDPDRLARFEREARVLASLNHPNIGHIYGLEEAEPSTLRRDSGATPIQVEGATGSGQGAVKALVLELIEGPTLADRITRGPIPVDEALPMAKQIAEALEAAHEAGVIHRDLKPANIKVREDGTVKVLDFGLAKALDMSPENDPSQSPTLTAAATQMGVIMGTAAYMSPEQARGKAVDKRSDVWAFGCVLYEMLTGQRAFEGEDISVTLADVIRADVAWDTLPADLPATLPAYLRRCLAKDPKSRVRDMGDLRLAMEGAFDSGVTMSGEVGTRAAARGIWPRSPVLGVAAVVLFGLGAVTYRTANPVEVPSVVRFSVTHDGQQPPYVAQQSPDVAVSPTGHHLAYLTGSAGDQLHVRSLARPSSQLLAEGTLNSPFFSPDGLTVGFYRRLGGGSSLSRVSVQGGQVSTICDLPADLRGASWMDDGSIVFGTQDVTSGLWRVPAVGGSPQPLTTVDKEQGELNHVWPSALPDGEHVLFSILKREIDQSQVAVLSLISGEQQILLAGGTSPRYAPSGHLLYVTDDTLWAVRFDPDQLRIDGAPAPTVEDIQTKSLGGANYAVADNGSLVYMPAHSANAVARTLVWVDRDGREEDVGAPPAAYESPQISPDGRRIAVEIADPDNADVYIYDLSRETSTRLTLDASTDRIPLWTPDGQRVLFSSTRDGSFAIYAKTADGTGPTERVTTGAGLQWPDSWSADGETLVVGVNPSSQFDLHTMQFGETTETVGLILSPYRELNSRVSRDGRWIAYESDESGRYEIYVRPFPAVDSGRWQILRDGGHSPVWNSDTSELYYRTPAGAMMAVQVEGGQGFRARNPERLFEGPYLLTIPIGGRGRSWDLAEDGRFLMIRDGTGDVGNATAIRVVLNWDQELLEQLPVD